jgi:linoleoyl-CoA desaturase
MTTTAEAYGLSTEALDALGRELDTLREQAMADRGARDVDYIRRVIRWQRGLELTGRASLVLGWLPPFWLLGAGALSISKILDNMEIGHNVMHGQYDWTRDPALASKDFEWDTACPADQWRHSHNYLHHTYTNVHGKDRDIGYAVLRVSPDQKWTPAALGNPIYATLLAMFFQYGVMMHDVEIERLRKGEKTWGEAKATLVSGLRKSGKQGLKDYVLWPALTGPSFIPAVLASATANLARNLWSFTIIFCGHFPAGVHEFSAEECENESRGHWYFRQALGSANLTGSKLFHLLTGNLSHQIEHHLYPDLPAHRYPEIAPQVREICERYGLPYNTGRLSKQFGTVVGKILRYALPGGSGRSSSTPPRTTAAAPLPIAA